MQGSEFVTLHNAGEVTIPSFDHGVGDPVADGLTVKPQNKIVLVEGNYLLLGETPGPAVSLVQAVTVLQLYVCPDMHADAMQTCLPGKTFAMYFMKHGTSTVTLTLLWNECLSVRLDMGGRLKLLDGELKTMIARMHC